jgi:hypothetical protein
MVEAKKDSQQMIHLTGPPAHRRGEGKRYQCKGMRA